MTSSVKEVLKLSLKETNYLGEKEVQEEHILLGLIKEGKGIAGILLRHHGISIEHVYVELIRRRNQTVYMPPPYGQPPLQS